MGWDRGHSNHRIVGRRGAGAMRAREREINEFTRHKSPHCLPTPRASHHASMVLSRILIATPYNDSKTVRRPAPRDHPPAFSRHRLPLAPETCTTFTRGCMSSGPRSTRSQRLPRACSDFIRGSGLVGRTVWKVMMAHLEYELRSRPVRAMWDDFDAIVAGHSGR